MPWSVGPRYCWTTLQLSRLPLITHSALALFLVALASGVARAEPQLFVHLDYQVEPGLSGCPSDETFQDMVAAQLGYAPFRADSEYRVVARARADVGGLEGFVEWQDNAGASRGRRELRAERQDCAALARAMSFAIAVQIQLFTEEAARGEPSTPAATTEPSKPGASVAPPAAPLADPPRANDPADRDRASSESSRSRFLIGAGPLLAFWLAPSTAVGARLFAGVHHGMWLAELGVEATLPGSYGTENARGFDHRVELGSLAGCALLRPFAGCLVGKVGRLEVTGYGVDMPRSSSGLLLQVGPRVALSDLIGESWLGAIRLEALVTAPWRVTLNQTEAWRTPPLTIAAGLDVAALFP
ncbi:MAG TPA: hypothetical protein VG937_14210 [Polyangiaceae bacterium]|nr:hypothetical protein [Polyangiaceae bacterium]